MGKGIFAEVEQCGFFFVVVVFVFFCFFVFVFVFSWLHDLQHLSLSGIEPGPRK